MLDLVTFLLTGGYTPTSEEAQRPAHVTVETGVGVCLLVLCVLGVYVCLSCCFSIRAGASFEQYQETSQEL